MPMKHFIYILPLFVAASCNTSDIEQQAEAVCACEQEALAVPSKQSECNALRTTFRETYGQDESAVKLYTASLLACSNSDTATVTK